MHSRQEIRFPLRKKDKEEEDVGGRAEEGAGTELSQLNDCHPRLRRSSYHGRNPDPLLLSSHRIHGHSSLS